jgi:hypothetical protein
MRRVNPLAPSAVAVVGVVVASAGSASALGPPPVLRLAGFFPMEGPWDGGISVWPAVRLALADVNADPSVLPNTSLEVVFHNSQCSKATATSQLIDAHYAYATRLRNSTDPPFIGVLGGGCSGVCEAQALLADLWGYAAVSYACTSPTLSDAPHLVRTKAADTGMADVYHALATDERHKWRRVATVVEERGNTEATMGRFTSLAADSGLTVALAATLPDMNVADDETLRNATESLVAELMQVDVKIVFVVACVCCPRL